MKNIIKLARLLVLLPLVLIATELWAGGSVENGGDAIGIEFKTIGFSVLANIKSTGTLVFSHVLIEQLSKTLSNAKVDSTDAPLAINGIRKDAINYPEQQRILVSRQSWLTIELVTKKALILHELLGLLRFDDGGYMYSMLLKGAEASSQSEPNAGLYFKNGSESGCFYEVSISSSVNLRFINFTAVSNPVTRQYCESEGAGTIFVCDSDGGICRSSDWSDPANKVVVGLQTIDASNFFTVQQKCADNEAYPCNFSSPSLLSKFRFHSNQASVPALYFKSLSWKEHTNASTEEWALTRASELCGKVENEAIRNAKDKCMNYLGGLYRDCDFMNTTKSITARYEGEGYYWVGRCEVTASVKGH